MALGLDFLTQIINVQWVSFGGIFATAGVNTNVLYAKLEKKDDEDRKFTSLGALDFTIGGIINASAYRNMETNPEATARPLFLLGGTDEGDDEGNNAAGIIMASTDGNHWTRVAFFQDFDHPRNDISILGIVWDESASRFYAGALLSKVIIGPPTVDGFPGSITGEAWEIIYSSAEGTTWNEDTRALISTTGTVGEDYKPMFSGHCNNKAELQDGVFGYYEKKDENGIVTKSVLAVPTRPPKVNYFATFVDTDPKPSVKITITKDGAITITTAATPIAVNAVAYASGALIAVGKETGAGHWEKGEIAISVDDGKTWEKVTHPSCDELFTVCGGPLTDQPKEPE